MTFQASLKVRELRLRDDGHVLLNVPLDQGGRYRSVAPDVATVETLIPATAGQASDVAQSRLSYGLFFELAPLLSGLFLVALSSPARVSELAIMHRHDEFQGVAVVSGWLTVTLLHDLPLLQVTSRFPELADPWLIRVSLDKSAVMGLLIGVIACHHGSSTERSSHALSDTAIHAVGDGMVAVMVYWVKR